MALDLDAALNAAYEIEKNISEIVEILRVYKTGRVSVPEIGDIVFTTGQKQTLANRYTVLKSTLAGLYNQLP